MTLGSGAAYLPPELASKLSKVIPKTANFSEGEWLLPLHLSLSKKLTLTNSFRSYFYMQVMACRRL